MDARHGQRTAGINGDDVGMGMFAAQRGACLLYTSDAADERSSVDLGGRRIIKKKNSCRSGRGWSAHMTKCIRM